MARGDIGLLMSQRFFVLAFLVASAGAVFSCANGDAPDGLGSSEGGSIGVGQAGTLGLTSGVGGGVVNHAGAGGAVAVAGSTGFAGHVEGASGSFATTGGSSSNGGSPSGGAASGGSASGGSAHGGSTNHAGASAGGSSGSAGAAGYPGLPPFGPAPVDKPGTVEIGVRNGCSFSLFIHGDGAGGTLQPDDQEIKPGGIAWYDAPQNWSAARVTAFTDGPRQTETDKVEMTLVNNNDASGEVLNYNVTYVDWLGLPVEIRSRGTGGDCKPVGCYIPESNVTNGCPDGLLDGKKCQSARSYCLNPANQSQPYCNALSGEIQKCAQTYPDCAGAAGSSTPEVYACSGGFFSGSPKWCAALNRHTLASPDSTDKSTYYQTAPYNTYSKWVHDSCPGIYAFPYDDYPSTSGESGFHSCVQGKELDITFCPKG